MSKKKFLKNFAAPILIATCLLVVFVFQTNSGTISRVKSGLEIAEAGKLKLEFFDVGQGDASLIVTPEGKKILVDGGPDNSVINKLGQALPFYDKKIDDIILTHPHADHVAGLVEVLKRYQVGKIYMTGVLHTAPDYLEFLQIIKEKNIPVEIIKDQHNENIENNLQIDYLLPISDISSQKFENLNLSSIVFKLTYVSSTVLYTGDAENEERLTTSTDIKADILKVGHHGSINANDEEFLKAVSPIYAVIPVGLNNSYHLPGFRTIYYLNKLGAKVFRTDESGDVEFLSDGHGWQVARPRQN